MKKIILGVLTVTALTTASAQTKTGDWMVGGNFRLNTAKNATEISFSPNAGMFVVDNLAVGGNLELTHSKAGESKSTAFGIGPFVRYYFTTENQPVRPIVHTYFNYLSTKYSSGSFSEKVSGTNFFIGGGAAIFISDNVSIDALMGYERTKYKDYDGTGGFSFNIGFQVYLLKGQVDKVRGK